MTDVDVDVETQYKMVKAMLRNAIVSNEWVMWLYRRNDIDEEYHITSDIIIHNFAINFGLDYERLKETKFEGYLETKRRIESQHMSQM